MRRSRRLTAAERTLWSAFPSGDWVDLRTGDREHDDPAQAHTWGRERQIRAEVITELLMGAAERQPGRVPALRLAGARVVGDLNLSESTLETTLHLLNCHAGAVDLTDATTRSVRLRGCELDRVIASRAQVSGVLDLNGSTIAHGVRIDNARIEGQLRISHATVGAPPPPASSTEGGHYDVREPESPLVGRSQHEWAIWAGGVAVTGAVFLRELTATGGIRMIGGAFPGGLYLRGSQITALGPVAINLDYCTAGAVELDDGFTARGTVRMRSGTITGTLFISDATLIAEERSLHVTHMQIDELVLLPRHIEGEVNLRYSRIGVLSDRPGSYPSRVMLDGLTYESMRGTWRVDERIAWLARDTRGYRPHPYEQLAAWYRRIGHESDARRVLLAKRRRQTGTRRPRARMAGALLDVTVGYGYRSWLAGLWAALLLTAGTLVFSTWRPTKVDPDEMRTFYPFVYTLDLLVPVSVFEARGAWEPVGWTVWVAWTLIVSGWVLATALIAGATRILRPGA
ncbi:oxidoreductase [Nonomuraea soli]|uniref:Oxidoreductase n=1 Tax=Nonomuraea soli TaxID=1032476 RepID=A0A7W0HTD0_9ACTN|nr:oxidoreductase [Nonomuraea soli]MBA2894984.1 hypothetical protein [Nonomuraea soli]